MAERDEGRLARWSRRKREQREQGEPAAGVEAAAVEPLPAAAARPASPALR